MSFVHECRGTLLFVQNPLLLARTGCEKLEIRSADEEIDTAKPKGFCPTARVSNAFVLPKFKLSKNYVFKRTYLHYRDPRANCKGHFWPPPERGAKADEDRFGF